MGSNSNYILLRSFDCLLFRFFKKLFKQFFLINIFCYDSHFKQFGLFEMCRVPTSTPLILIIYKDGIVWGSFFLKVDSNFCSIIIQTNVYIRLKKWVCTSWLFFFLMICWWIFLRLNGAISKLYLKIIFVSDMMQGLECK